MTTLSRRPTVAAAVVEPREGSFFATVMWFVVLLAHMQSIYVLASPVSAVLLVAWLALSGRLSSKVPPRVTPLLVGFFIYLVALMLLNGSTANIGVVDFIAQYGRLLYLVAFLVLMLAVRLDRPMEVAFYRAVTLSAGVIAVGVLVDRFVHGFAVGGLPFTYGPFQGHNSLSATIAPAAVLAVLRWLRMSGEQRVGWTQHVCGAVIVAVFMLGQSRGYTLGVAAAGAYAIVARLGAELHTGRLTVRSLVSVVAAPVAVFGMVQALASRLHDLGADQNVVARFDLWSRAWDLFLTNPIVGYGLGVFQLQDLQTTAVIPGLFAVRTGGFYSTKIAFDAQGGLHAHDVYLQLAVEVGLVGIGVLAVLYGAGWRRARWVRAGVPGEASVSAHVYPAMLVHLAVAGLTAGFTFTSPTMAIPLYFALARVWRAVEFGKTETPPASPAGTERARSAAGRQASLVAT